MVKKGAVRLTDKIKSHFSGGKFSMQSTYWTPEDRITWRLEERQYPQILNYSNFCSPALFTKMSGLLPHFLVMKANMSSISSRFAMLAPW